MFDASRLQTTKRAPPADSFLLAILNPSLKSAKFRHSTRDYWVRAKGWLWNASWLLIWRPTMILAQMPPKNVDRYWMHDIIDIADARKRRNFSACVKASVIEACCSNVKCLWFVSAYLVGLSLWWGLIVSICRRFILRWWSFYAVTRDYGMRLLWKIVLATRLLTLYQLLLPQKRTRN